MPIFILGQSEAEDSSRLGGKAHKLHLLKNAGFNVPGGFILTEPTLDLTSYIEKIGGYPVAVRSSGSMEDLAHASFAGLYETFLNVKDEEELARSIALCFASRDSERVKNYLDTKGIIYSPTALSMSVLVQKMVEPLIAGVLFTINPTNGFEEEFYLEFCQGLGERLVSGHVTPSRCSYNINRHQIVDLHINAENTHMDEKLLKQLISEARKIQAHFGTPQDIEWAIDHNHQLHILQSRPITTAVYRNDVPEMTNADLKDGGISARVCTPFMFSAYRNALQFSMGDYFKRINLIKNPDEIKWISQYYGRVYWNAGAVKEGLKQIPGFNEEDFDRDLGIQKDYGAQGAHKTKVSIASVINAIPVLIGLHREFSDCELMVSQFRDQFNFRDEQLKERLPLLKRMSEQEFGQWFLEVIHFQVLTERNYFRTIYNNSNFQSEFKTSLKKMKGYQEGDEIELMGHLSGVSHLDVQADLERLTHKADFFGLDSNAYHKEREVFLSKHYHHGPAELDLTVPRWGEKKEWVDELVKAFLPTSKKSNTSFNETCERLMKHASWMTRKIFKKNLERSRNFLKIREEMRSFSTRAYYLLRQGMLEFGKRRSIEDHLLFMLDLDEVKVLVSETSGSLPQLLDRYLHYQAYRDYNSPNEFGGSILQQASGSGNQLKGIGCSPGVITGRARVILDIHQTSQLTKEDILITAFTDPGWTPVLARVAGVVTEVGGLLSHAAVIGREYGIPAILNLSGATKTIKDGSLIQIDGKTGVVTVLEESP